MASDHRVKSHSEAPNIDQLWVIGSLSNYFWWRVRRRAADSVSHSFTYLSPAAEPEVDQLGIPICVKEHVLRLDVAVAQLVGLEIEECRQNLVRDSCCFLFVEGSLSVDELVELSVAAIFHEDVDLALVLHHFVHLRDVLVDERALQLNLKRNGLRSQPVLRHCADLHCHCLSSQPVYCPPYCPETTHTQRLF